MNTPAEGPGPMAQRNPPKRQMLTDDVYKTVRNHLLAGRFKPGSWLNLDQLARQLNVSNTPIRQALGRLEAEGLVTKLPYRGFAVANALDMETVEDIYFGRNLLEPTLASLAAQKASPDELDELGRLLQRIDVIVARDPADWADGHVKACLEADETFHRTISRMGGNKITEQMAAWLQDRMMPNRSLFLRGDAAAKSHSEHLAVFAALRDGNPQAAENAMKSHLDAALGRFRSASA
ncbi:DNA-binding GntR family transcriptional regulator [Arthrobacter pascens]|uniref:GntR family transcriptional regulator n=1 Tax=Arthrobacter pascens TaxID=1677 RepID=UPI0027832B67|nr:GntR family transcriptional regulator [Arthrobacter pascens]MDQ0634174.1 DNA-binding GntR family transcriptional regulator [Arthrobacter pascens]